MINYGLIFKDGDGDIWLGEYTNEGAIPSFSALSDFEGIYEDLELSKFALVEIENKENDQVLIHDISVFEIGRQDENTGEEGDLVPVTAMLTELHFPSEKCNEIFMKFLASVGKTN